MLARRDDDAKANPTLHLQNKLKLGHEISSWKRISTGSDTINSITRGGFPANGISEIIGCAGVGKTQLCLQMSLMVQLPPDHGGFNKGTFYICTEDAFPSKRLHQIAEEFTRRHCDIDFESNICITHVADYEQLKRCLCQTLPRLLKFRQIGLIVIDSIAGLFRSNEKHSNYSHRSKEFVYIATVLHKLSSKHEIAVVSVNQVTDNVASGKTEACLGLAWGNLVTSRFSINRYGLRDENREFEVIFAPDLAPRICNFKILPKGVI